MIENLAYFLVLSFVSTVAFVGMGELGKLRHRQVFAVAAFMAPVVFVTAYLA